MFAPVDPPFEPPSWLRGGHLQTLAAAYWPGRLDAYAAVQHEVGLPDGDRIILHDDCPEAWRPGDRCVLMLHGVCGCHLSPYLVRAASKLNVAGVRTFRMDQRGCGAGAGLAQWPGHAGRSEDAAAAAERIAALCPQSPLSLIGYSLGGNIVLKLLGEAGDAPPAHIDSALAVAPPIDLVTCARQLSTGTRRWYSRSFARRLLQLVEHRLADFNEGPPVAVAKPRYLWEFDAWYTAPRSGFVDVWDYYRRCSAKPLLDRIRVPTLVLVAQDDPLIPWETFADLPASDHVQLAVTRYGGHLGYIARQGIDPDRRWLDWRIRDWITRLK